MKHLFLLLLLVATSTEARWLTKQEAGSIVEKFHSDFEVFKNGSWIQTNEYVVRVQSEDAKVNSSLFPIEYNAATDQVEILEAYTLNGKHKIKVEDSAIEDRDKGESKDYDALKVRSVVFSQVQIGSKLHLKYRVKTAKPLIENRWSTAVTLSPGMHIESFRFAVKSEVPLHHFVKDPQKWVTVKRLAPNLFEVRNRSLIPGWVQAEKEPVFHPANFTEIFVSTHKSWQDFLSPLTNDYAKVMAQPLPANLKPWLKKANKEKTVSGKINVLMQNMSEHFRYFGDWRRHNGGLVPRDLKDIEASRYGDCKDLSTLLTVMLRALHLNASVAMVRRGANPWVSEPDYVLPGLNYFNHAVVHVADGKDEYWLDPTNPVMSLRPYPDISGRPAWILSEAARFARLPSPQPQDFEHVHRYEYRFNGGDIVKVKVSAELLNLAAYDVANDLMLSPRSEVLSDTLEYFSEGQEVKSHKFITQPTSGRLLKDMKVELEYLAGRLAFTAGKALFWVIPDGFLQGAFYETHDRASDLQLGEEPYVFKVVRRLKDIRLAQEAPEPCLIDSPWMNLERRIQVEEKDVVIAQTVTLRKPFVTREEFLSPAFRKLQIEAQRCFYRSGVLIEPLNRALSKNAQ